MANSSGCANAKGSQLQGANPEPDLAGAVPPEPRYKFAGPFSHLDATERITAAFPRGNKTRHFVRH